MLLRLHFERPIRKLADVAVEHHQPGSSLVDLIETALQEDMQVIPICDAEGRIKGLVSTDDLLRGLHHGATAKGGGSV